MSDDEGLSGMGSVSEEVEGQFNFTGNAKKLIKSLF